MEASQNANPLGHSCRSLSTAEKLSEELTPRILEKQELVKGIFEFVIFAPNVAVKAKAGQFIVVIPDSVGERIPLTIADWDCERGTVTRHLHGRRGLDAEDGEDEPRGRAQGAHGTTGPCFPRWRTTGTVVVVAGGVGTAPVFPIARALKASGNKVIAIQGARSKESSLA